MEARAKSIFKSLDLPDYVALLFELNQVKNLQDLADLNEIKIRAVEASVSDGKLDELVDFNSASEKKKYLGFDYKDVKAFRFKPFDFRKLLRISSAAKDEIERVIVAVAMTPNRVKKNVATVELDESTAKDDEDIKFFKNLNKVTYELEGKTELSEKEMNKKSALTDQIVKNVNEQLRRNKCKSLACIQEEKLKISVLQDSSMRACVVCPLCAKLIRLSITKYNSSAVHNFTRHIMRSHEDPGIKDIALLSKRKRVKQDKKRSESHSSSDDEKTSEISQNKKRGLNLTQKVKKSLKIETDDDYEVAEDDIEINQNKNLRNVKSKNFETDKITSEEVIKKINKILERIGKKSLITRKSVETIKTHSGKIIKIVCPLCKNHVILNQINSRISLHNFNRHLAKAHKHEELLRSKKRREVRTLEKQENLKETSKKASRKPKKTVEYLYEKIVWKVNQIMSRTSREERVVLADVEIIREDSDQEEDNSSNLKVEVKCPICRQVVRLSFNSYFAISANNMRRHLIKKDRLEVAEQIKLDSYEVNYTSKNSGNNGDMTVPELRVKVINRINEILDRSSIDSRLTDKDVQIISQIKMNSNSKKIDPLKLKGIAQCPVCEQKIRIQFTKFYSIATTNFKRHLISSHNVEILEPNKFEKTVCPTKIQNSSEKIIIRKKRKQPRKDSEEERQNYFNCQLCDEKFNTRSSLTNHANSHTRQLTVVEKTYYCDLCPSIYKSKRGLRDHIIVYHLKRRDHECDECGRCYTTNSVLREHKKNVHWKKNFLANLLVDLD